MIGGKPSRANFAHTVEDPSLYFYDNRGKENEETSVLLVDESKGGLAHPRALLFLGLWYIFSGCTLFLNKYILSYMEADPTILGKLLIYL